MAVLDYKDLEAQLFESGNKLAEPPSSVDELLELLDKVEGCLSKVEQSPARSMQNALDPSLKALVGDKLLKHSDVDVKVAVASCISEITRITAPDAPYEDDEMRDVFQLIVSSFENLSDETSRSYAKRTSILETVSKVRSCVVMLDLECDALIVDMFQHFLNSIRDHHPDNVFSSMETIMSLVLEESEDISEELLIPILASLKIGDERLLPIAKKLGERVLESCATKVKPYLVQTIKTLNKVPNDYSVVVTTICQDAEDDVENNTVQASNGNMADDSETAKSALDEEALEDKEVAEGASVERVDPSTDGSPQSALSNGVTQTAGDDSLGDLSSLKKQEDDHPIENCKDLDVASNADPGSLNPEKEVNTEEKPEQAAEKGEKEPSSSEQSAKPLESPLIDNEKEKDKLPDQEGQNKDIPGSPAGGTSAEEGAVEKDEGSDVKLSSPKTLETASAEAAPASPSGTTLEEVHSEKIEPEEKDGSDKEVAPPADDIPEKVADVTSDSETRQSRHARKKMPAASSSEIETKASAEVDVDVPMKDSEAASDSEEKPLKQTVKKGGNKKNRNRSSSKKKPARGKSVEDTKKVPAKDNIKDIVVSPKLTAKSTKDEEKEESPKTDLKRKRTPAKEKESEVQDFGQSLVGSKVKVWWPDDKKYYDGTIKSFDLVKKKHTVLYTDGEKETLNLKKERWEFIGGGSSDSDVDEETVRSSPEASTEAPLKKAKTKSGGRSKIKKVEASPKKVGGGSSSKSKATTPKSRGGRSDGKSKDEPTKSVGKPEGASSGKSKDQTPKGGTTKSTIISFKTSSKPKATESQTPKASTKSKDEASSPSKSKLAVVTPKSAKSKSASKDKPSSGGAKSSANGSGKVKSSSTKVKESENVKEDASDSDEVPEITKAKSPIQSKSGKKRRRGVKG